MSKSALTDEALHQILHAVLRVAQQNQNDAKELHANLEVAIEVAKEAHRTLAGTVSMEVTKKIEDTVKSVPEQLMAKFGAASKAADAAAAAYEKSAKKARRTIFIPSILISLFFILLSAGGVWYVKSLLTEVELEKQRYASLTSSIDYLDALQRSDIVRCQDNSGHTRICIHLDTKGGKAPNGYHMVAAK